MEKESAGLPQRIAAALKGMWRHSENLSFKGVRWQRCHYYLAYAFELLLFSAVQLYMPVRTQLAGVSAFTIMQASHVLASLVVMLLWSRRFQPLVIGSIGVLVAGFLPYLFLPQGMPKLIFAVIAFAGLGGAVTCARCGYAFAANNTERLVGLLLMFAVTAALRFYNRPAQSAGVFFTHVIPALLLAGLVVCLLLFKENDLEAKESTTVSDSRGLYWALAYFIAYYSVNGFAVGLNHADYIHARFVCTLGSTLGIAAFFVVILLGKSVWHIWNLFLAVSILMATVGVFRPQSEAPLHLLTGLSEIGWPAAIYLLACAQNRFASYRLMKKCTVWFVLLSPATLAPAKLVGLLFPQLFNKTAFGFVLALVIGFFMLSPASNKYLFSAKWLLDLYKKEMAQWDAKMNANSRLDGYQLTPREKEVLKHLLAGHTLRQISAYLGIAQGTVNTHANRIYKKIGVNSKAELFVLFGASTDAETLD
jgi:DNA-binding CsgD family transcriptional regulator